MSSCKFSRNKNRSWLSGLIFSFFCVASFSQSTNTVNRRFLDLSLDSDDVKSSICKVIVRGQTPSGIKENVGTAFALASNFAVTARHVVEGDWVSNADGTTARDVVVHCSNDGKRVSARASIQFPKNSGDSLDVAFLIPLTGQVISKKTLDCGGENAEIKIGEPLAVAGYSKHESALRLQRASGTLLPSIASLQHSDDLGRASFSLEEGFSGSPVFNLYGGVVGVHKGAIGDLANRSSLFTPLSKVASELPPSCRNSMAKTGLSACTRKCDDERGVQETEALAKYGLTFEHIARLERIELTWKQCKLDC
jgi:Trypsin-like peptidase domain